MKKHWFGVILLDNFIERYLVVMEISEYAVNFLVLAGLLLYGVISSRLSTRMNMPVLLLFLAVGIYLGSFQKLDFTLYKGAAVQFANVVEAVISRLASPATSSRVRIPIFCVSRSFSSPRQTI